MATENVLPIDVVRELNELRAVKTMYRNYRDSVRKVLAENHETITRLTDQVDTVKAIIRVDGEDVSIPNEATELLLETLDLVDGSPVDMDTIAYEDFLSDEEADEHFKQMEDAEFENEDRALINTP